MGKGLGNSGLSHQTYFNITYISFISAFDMLSVSHDEVTVEKLAKALPDVFTQLVDGRNLVGQHARFNRQLK
jgi:hypothetical protein